MDRVTTDVSWVCHAQPASLGGKPCGYSNTGAPMLHMGRVCCRACGCTKKASDDRLAEMLRGPR